MTNSLMRRASSYARSRLCHQSQGEDERRYLYRNNLAGQESIGRRFLFGQEISVRCNRRRREQGNYTRTEDAATLYWASVNLEEAKDVKALS